MIETYQINQLKESGHEIEIWYLGNLFGISNNIVLNAPAIQEYVVMINSIAVLKEKVQKLEPRAILFSTLGMIYYYPILFKTIKSREDLIWIARITKQLPRGGNKGQHPVTAIVGGIFFYNLYKPIGNLALYLGQKVIRKVGGRIGVKAYQPDYLMVSNSKQVPANFPKDKVIVTHADDYNIHLLTKDIAPDPATQDAIVFLDQMLYYHPDFKKLGESMMDVDTYYKRLNKLLDDISDKYNKPVVIAGHPEADKHPGYEARFEGKKFVTGKSVSLVRHAAMVVTHYSTAVNFAVIYNKPVLMVSSRSFAGFEKIMGPIRVLSTALKAPVVDMDNPDLDSLGVKLEPDYKKYKDTYVKSDHTPEELSYPYAVKYVSGSVKSKSVKYSMTHS